MKKELAAAEGVILNLKKTIAALEDEVQSGGGKPMPHVVELQEQVMEMQARVRVQEEEKHALEEQLEELKDKVKIEENLFEIIFIEKI